MCARGFALPAQHRHAFAVEGIAAEIAFHDAIWRTGAAPDHGVVDALDGMGGELFGKAAHGALVFGRDQQPAGVLVQPVHDARPRHAADAGERIAAMGEQRIDQRAVQIAGRGMHDKSRGFVDHDQIGIFVTDRKRNILRLWRRGLWRRNGDRNDVAPV